MDRVRSILWVGGAEALRAEAVAESPLLDVAWARNADDAASLPLAAFDAVVLDAASGASARDALGALQSGDRDACPPVLVLLPASDADEEAKLRAAGAAAIALHGADGTSAAARGERLVALLGGVARSPLRRPDPAAPAPDEKRAVAPIARSPKMRAVLALAERAMPSQATVLITGEDVK